MIQNIVQNICLIGFALVGPISLPAGGIQKNFNEFLNCNNSKEIILISDCALYTFPKLNAKQLAVISSGSSISILRKWQGKENDIWVRVELGKNVLINNPIEPKKGWIKI